MLSWFEVLQYTIVGIEYRIHIVVLHHSSSTARLLRQHTIQRSFRAGHAVSFFPPYLSRFPPYLFAPAMPNLFSRHIFRYFWRGLLFGGKLTSTRQLVLAGKLDQHHALDIDIGSRRHRHHTTSTTITTTKIDIYS